ncbi:hypothetical protein C1N68_27885 (plasmid) [Priestia aryabhattai]
MNCIEVLKTTKKMQDFIQKHARSVPAKTLLHQRCIKSCIKEKTKKQKSPCAPRTHFFHIFPKE